MNELKELSSGGVWKCSSPSVWGYDLIISSLQFGVIWLQTPRSRLFKNLGYVESSKSILEATDAFGSMLLLLLEADNNYEVSGKGCNTSNDDYCALKAKRLWVLPMQNFSFCIMWIFSRYLLFCDVVRFCFQRVREAGLSCLAKEKRD